MMHRHGHSAATPDVDAMQAHALAHATSSLGSDVETGYDSEEVGPLLHIDATTHTNEAHHTQHAASGTHSHLHGHHASYDLLPALSSVLTHIGSALTPPGLQAAVREHEHDLLHGSPDCSDNSDGEPDASSTRLYPTTSAVAVTSVSPHRVSPSPPAASCCCGARFPRTRRGITLLALFVVAIALCLDTFVIRRPYGFLVWHELTGVGRSQQPPQTCGWDYEASWKIGQQRHAVCAGEAIVFGRSKAWNADISFVCLVPSCVQAPCPVHLLCRSVRPTARTPRFTAARFRTFLRASSPTPSSSSRAMSSASTRPNPLLNCRPPPTSPHAIRRAPPAPRPARSPSRHGCSRVRSAT